MQQNNVTEIQACNKDHCFIQMTHKLLNFFVLASLLAIATIQGLYAMVCLECWLVLKWLSVI